MAFQARLQLWTLLALHCIAHASCCWGVDTHWYCHVVNYCVNMMHDMTHVFVNTIPATSRMHSGDVAMQTFPVILFFRAINPLRFLEVDDVLF